MKMIPYSPLLTNLLVVVVVVVRGKVRVVVVVRANWVLRKDVVVVVRLSKGMMKGRMRRRTRLMRRGRRMMARMRRKGRGLVAVVLPVQQQVSC